MLSLYRGYVPGPRDGACPGMMPLIRLRSARLAARRHQVEAFFDLAERQREGFALPCGKAGQDFLFAALEARDQLLIQREALAGQAQGELTAVVGVLDALDQLALHQR